MEAARRRRRPANGLQRTGLNRSVTVKSGYHCSPKPMNMKAWIDDYSPRFSYLCGYTRYWGYSNFCETFDNSNVSQDPNPGTMAINPSTLYFSLNEDCLSSSMLLCPYVRYYWTHLLSSGTPILIQIKGFFLVIICR